jgi:thiamine biosynthesis lipoprotein
MSKVYHNSFFAMGTRFNAVLPNADEELCEHLFRMIENEVKRIEEKYNYFDESSLVSKINRNAFKSELELDDEMFEIISLCVDYHKLTLGAFDITMRRLIDFYNQNPEANKSELGSCMKAISLNRGNKSIRFLDEETKIDFGAFGKGYALKKVKRMVEESYFENAFFSFGESSILALGNHPNGIGWKIGIKDYSTTDSTAYTDILFNESISTSANYFKNDYGELIYKTNVINPLNSSFNKSIETISVKSIDPVECEILSTAFINLNDDQIKEIKNNLRIEIIRVRYLEKDKIITCL